MSAGVRVQAGAGRGDSSMTANKRLGRVLRGTRAALRFEPPDSRKHPTTPRGHVPPAIFQGPAGTRRWKRSGTIVRFANATAQAGRNRNARNLVVVGGSLPPGGKPAQLEPSMPVRMDMVTNLTPLDNDNDAAEQEAIR